jgi:drug/metabolite transporter (DMT)-like permease
MGAPIAVDRDHGYHVRHLSAPSPAPLRLIVLAYCTCAVVWGTTWFTVRACIGPGGYPTLEGAALRFLLATLLLLPFALRIGSRPASLRQWGWLVAAGVLDAVGYALVYLGEERVPGGLAAVLFATQPLIMALLLTATGLERIRPTDFVGALVSLAGVGVIFADRVDVSERQAIGVAMVLGSVVVSTIYAMILKRHGAGIHAVVSTTIFIGVTAICLWLAVFATGGPDIPWPPPVAPTLALIYLAVLGSVVAFVTYIWLLSHVKLMTVGTLSFVLPVIALMVDAAFEREIRLEARAYAGIAVTLAGLAVSLALRPRAAR